MYDGKKCSFIFIVKEENKRSEGGNCNPKWSRCSWGWACLWCCSHFCFIQRHLRGMYIHTNKMNLVYLPSTNVSSFCIAHIIVINHVFLLESCCKLLCCTHGYNEMLISTSNSKLCIHSCCLQHTACDWSFWEGNSCSCDWLVFA